MKISDPLSKIYPSLPRWSEELGQARASIYFFGKEVYVCGFVRIQRPQPIIPLLGAEEIGDDIYKIGLFNVEGQSILGFTGDAEQSANREVYDLLRSALPGLKVEAPWGKGKLSDKAYSRLAAALFNLIGQRVDEGDLHDVELLKASIGLTDSPNAINEIDAPDKAAIVGLIKFRPPR